MVENNADESIESNKDESIESEIMIPIRRFEQIESKFERAQNDLKTIQEEIEADAGKYLEEDEEGEDGPGMDIEANIKSIQIEIVDIKKQIDIHSARVTELLETIDTIVGYQIEKIPEEFRELIPEMENVSLMQWLSSAESKGLFMQAGEEDNSRISLGNRTNGGKVSPSSDDSESYSEALLKKSYQ